jgi:ABC-type transport system involved in multi-copper enzyme maturation permease subunit
MLTKEKIKSSLSARWHLHNLKSFGVIGLIYGAAMLCQATLSSYLHRDFHLAISITGIIFLVFVLGICPFVIYEIYSYKKLFKDVDMYEICEAKLDKPTTSIMRKGAVYYSLYFQLSDHINVYKDTKPMWSSGIFAQNQLEYYNNKTVEVAYDRENDRLIIIGLKKR